MGWHHVWNKYVPLKVVTFVWRLIKYRTPRKENFSWREIIFIDKHFCTGCSIEVKYASHLILCYGRLAQV